MLEITHKHYSFQSLWPRLVNPRGVCNTLYILTSKSEYCIWEKNLIPEKITILQFSIWTPVRVSGERPFFDSLALSHLRTTITPKCREFFILFIIYVYILQLWIYTQLYLRHGKKRVVVGTLPVKPLTNRVTLSQWYYYYIYITITFTHVTSFLKKSVGLGLRWRRWWWWRRWRLSLVFVDNTSPPARAPSSSAKRPFGPVPLSLPKTFVR